MAQVQQARGYKAQAVRRTVLKWIEQGRFVHGQQLPSERALADELGVNHLTVRRGLADLVREGTIVRQAGVGSFVNVATTVPVRLGLAIPQSLFRVESHAAPSQILQGIHQVIDPRQYSVQTLPYGHGQLWEQVGQIAISSHLRGLIVAPDWKVTPHDLDRLVAGGLEVVLLNPHATQMGCGLSWSRADVVGPAVQTIHHLLKLGHQHIAVVQYEQSYSCIETTAAVRTLLAEKPYRHIQPTYVTLPNVTVLDMQPLIELFDAPMLPTALVVPDETIATQVFYQCHQRGIAIPRQLSLIALANYAPQLMPIRLASPDSVTQRVLVAQSATRQLLEQLQSSPRRDYAVNVQAAGMNWGESIAPPDPGLSPEPHGRSRAADDLIAAGLASTAP